MESKDNQIKENKKDKDKLVASFSPNSSPKNFTIKYLLQLKIQLLSLVSRVQQLVQNWKIERISLKWQKPWAPPISVSFSILKGSKEEAV